MILILNKNVYKIQLFKHKIQSHQQELLAILLLFNALYCPALDPYTNPKQVAIQWAKAFCCKNTKCNTLFACKLFDVNSRWTNCGLQALITPDCELCQSSCQTNNKLRKVKGKYANS